MKIQLCILLFTTSIFAVKLRINGSYHNYDTGASVIFKISWNEEIEDDELNKFDGSAGSGYNGAPGYLRRPFLRDTVVLGVRRGGIVSGKIKVRN